MSYTSLDEIAALQSTKPMIPTVPATPVQHEVEIPSQPLVVRSNPEAAPLAPASPSLLQRVPWWVWVGGTLALAGGAYWYFLREKPEEEDVRENPSGPKASWRDVADALHAAASAKSLVS